MAKNKRLSQTKVDTTKKNLRKTLTLSHSTFRKFEIPISNFNDLDKIVDWIEMKVLIEKKDFNRSHLQSIFAKENLSLDKIHDVFLNMEKRQKFFADSWPFILKENKLCINKEFKLLVLYKFLLLFSLDIEILPKTRKLFEDYTTNVVQNIFSNKSSGGISIGSPRDESVPSSLYDALNYYGKISEEPFAFLRKINKCAKDAGLDSVVYRKFKDRRGANIHFWGQCATGLNWIQKKNDLDIEKIRLSFPILSRPLDFFSIPFIASESNINEMNVGLFLDRPRLLELSRKEKVPSLEEIGKCLIDYNLHEEEK